MCNMLNVTNLPRCCIRGGTGVVVLVARVEAGEVEFVVDQMIQRVFETAGEKLL